MTIVRTATLVALALGASHGCSDPTADTEDGTGNDRGDLDADAVAGAIRSVDPGAVKLDEADTLDYLRAVYAGKWGLERPEAACAAQELHSEIAPAGAVAEYLSGEAANQAEAAAAARCAAPRVPSAAGDQPAADMDIESARLALESYASAQASQVGLTEAESRCYGSSLVRSFDDAQVVAIFSRSGFSSDLDLGEVVQGCADRQRIGELSASIAEERESGGR